MPVYVLSGMAVHLLDLAISPLVFSTLAAQLWGVREPLLELYLVMLAVGINGVTIILGVAFLITGLYAYNARNAAVADADETSVFVVMAGQTKKDHK